jgi:hypothetical protein
VQADARRPCVLADLSSDHVRQGSSNSRSVLPEDRVRSLARVGFRRLIAWLRHQPVDHFVYLALLTVLGAQRTLKRDHRARGTLAGLLGEKGEDSSRLRMLVISSSVCP